MACKVSNSYLFTLMGHQNMYMYMYGVQRVHHAWLVRVHCMFLCVATDFVERSEKTSSPSLQVASKEPTTEPPVKRSPLADKVLPTSKPSSRAMLRDAAKSSGAAVAVSSSSSSSPNPRKTRRDDGWKEVGRRYMYIHCNL